MLTSGSIFRLRIDNILKASVTYIVDPDNPFSISLLKNVFFLQDSHHFYGAPISTASLSTIHTSVDQPGGCFLPHRSFFTPKG